ncbi:hypothetical protein [Streptomyces sp. NPDC050548]|uniref:hypothetical protein n=1 Tax=Streptomyces sp. NPDC050548 TaxID=3365629 RepID=UPI00378B3941
MFSRCRVAVPSAVGVPAGQEADRADGDRVAACVGIKDVTTGEPTHFIEQFTLKDGKIVENRVFYHDVGSMLDKPRVV